MCQRVTCSSCGKPTFAGCGRHVESVLGDVPREARCRCRERGERVETAGQKRPGFIENVLRTFRRES
jgi:hypothetical protein